MLGFGGAAVLSSHLYEGRSQEVPLRLEFFTDSHFAYHVMLFFERVSSNPSTFPSYYRVKGHFLASKTVWLRKPRSPL